MSVLLKNVVLRLLRRTFDADPSLELGSQLHFTFEELTRAEPASSGLLNAATHMSGSSSGVILCLKDCKYNEIEHIEQVIKDVLSFLHHSSTLCFCVFTSVTKKKIAQILPETFKVSKLTLEFVRICRQSLTDPELQSLMEKCVIGILELYVVLFAEQGQEYMRRKMQTCIRELAEEKLFRFKYDSVSVKIPNSTCILVKTTDISPKKESVNDFVAVDINVAEQNFSKSYSNGLVFHSDMHRRCPTIGAVIHAYPDNASALSCLAKPIHNFHALCRNLGPSPIMCAKYETFGSPEFLTSVMNCLVDGRVACLVANQGLVVVGETLDEVLESARLAEKLCCWYLKNLSIAAVVSPTENDQNTTDQKMTSNTNNTVDEKQFCGGVKKRTSGSTTPTSSSSDSEHNSSSKKKRTQVNGLPTSAKDFRTSISDNKQRNRNLANSGASVHLSGAKSKGFTPEHSSHFSENSTSQPVVSTSMPEKSNTADQQQFPRARSETRNGPSIDRRTFDHMYSNAFKRGKSVRE